MVRNSYYAKLGLIEINKEIMEKELDMKVAIISVSPKRRSVLNKLSKHEVFAKDVKLIEITYPSEGSGTKESLNQDIDVIKIDSLDLRIDENARIKFESKINEIHDSYDLIITLGEEEPVENKAGMELICPNSNKVIRYFTDIAEKQFNPELFRKNGILLDMDGLESSLGINKSGMIWFEIGNADMVYNAVYVRSIENGIAGLKCISSKDLISPKRFFFINESIMQFADTFFDIVLRRIM